MTQPVVTASVQHYFCTLYSAIAAIFLKQKLRFPGYQISLSE